MSADGARAGSRAADPAGVRTISTSPRAVAADDRAILDAVVGTAHGDRGEATPAAAVSGAFEPADGLRLWLVQRAAMRGGQLRIEENERDGSTVVVLPRAVPGVR